MLGLIRRVHTDFGISVLVTSHLLGELERTCDHVVVIDGGALLRSSSTSDFTQTTTTLAVEVTDSDDHPDGTDALRRALTGVGIKLVGHDGLDAEGLPGAGHILLVEATGEETYDLVRDSVSRPRSGTHPHGTATPPHRRGLPRRGDARRGPGSDGRCRTAEGERSR